MHEVCLWGPRYDIVKYRNKFGKYAHGAFLYWKANKFFLLEPIISKRKTSLGHFPCVPGATTAKIKHWVCFMKLLCRCNLPKSRPFTFKLVSKTDQKEEGPSLVNIAHLFISTSSFQMEPVVGNPLRGQGGWVATTWKFSVLRLFNVQEMCNKAKNMWQNQELFLRRNEGLFKPWEDSKREGG